MRPPDAPKYALVAYRDDTLGVIPFDFVEAAVEKWGAVVIAREFELEPAPVKNEQRNQNRAGDTGEDE